jgi:hypothetical protein
MEDTRASRKRRKEEGRLLKKKRIVESGGTRPREKSDAFPAHPPPAKRTAPNGYRPHTTKGQKQQQPEKHRFGRVMETTPCRNKPRHSTLSIAIPGSVVANCQTRELKTHLVGQIARAATIYHVDEIIVFDDKLAKDRKSGRSFHASRNRFDGSKGEKHVTSTEAATELTKNKVDACAEANDNDKLQTRPFSSSDPHMFMARVLQYCECPQYLRRHFFPMHPDLHLSGLLPPMDAPHHVRADDRCPYREGVVLDKIGGSGPDAGSLVNCGIRSRPVE